MTIGHNHVVDVTASLSVDGVEQEISLLVTGKYFAAQPAYTYAGEYAPTDPPEPAMFEIDRIDWHNSKTGCVELFPLQFCDGIWEAISEAALLEVESA